MFDNIGDKIRRVALALCIVGCLSSVIVGGMILVGGNGAEGIISGLLVVVLGCLASWGCSILVYGLGQLVDNSDVIVRQLNSLGSQGRRIEGLMQAQQPEDREQQPVCTEQRPGPALTRRAAQWPVPGQPVQKWVCPDCGANNRASVFCSGCGKYRKVNE